MASVIVCAHISLHVCCRYTKQQLEITTKLRTLKEDQEKSRIQSEKQQIHEKAANIIMFNMKGTEKERADRYKKFMKDKLKITSWEHLPKKFVHPKKNKDR